MSENEPKTRNAQTVRNAANVVVNSCTEPVLATQPAEQAPPTEVIPETSTAPPIYGTNSCTR